jgi:hypothetical protein
LRLPTAVLFGMGIKSAFERSRSDKERKKLPGRWPRKRLTHNSVEKMRRQCE